MWPPRPWPDKKTRSQWGHWKRLASRSAALASPRTLFCLSLDAASWPSSSASDLDQEAWARNMRERAASSILSSEELQQASASPSMRRLGRRGKEDSAWVSQSCTTEEEAPAPGTLGRRLLCRFRRSPCVGAAELTSVATVSEEEEDGEEEGDGRREVMWPPRTNHWRRRLDIRWSSSGVESSWIFEL